MNRNNPCAAGGEYVWVGEKLYKSARCGVQGYKRENLCRDLSTGISWILHL